MQIKHTSSFFPFSKGGDGTVHPCKNVEWNSAPTCNTSVQMVYLKITYLVQQPTQSADLLGKTQVTHPFKFCCAYKIFKKGFPHALQKPCKTTAIIRSTHNKDKPHKKYLSHERSIINQVLHEIFKRNRNKSKNCYGQEN